MSLKLAHNGRPAMSDFGPLYEQEQTYEGAHSAIIPKIGVGILGGGPSAISRAAPPIKPLILRSRLRKLLPISGPKGDPLYGCGILLFDQITQYIAMPNATAARTVFSRTSANMPNAKRAVPMSTSIIALPAVWP